MHASINPAWLFRRHRAWWFSPPSRTRPVAPRATSTHASRVMRASPHASIGRARELEQLRGSIHDVTAGAAATIVIEGEAGIGKTRLLEDVCTIAQDRGVRVFRGDAHPLERTRPFGAIVDALGIRIGSVDPRRAEIGQLLASREIAGAGGTPGGGVQFRVLEEIVELVEVLSDQGPVLVALDDLHWADSSTLLAFRWLMRRLTEAPLLLIGTVRPVPRTVELGQI